MKIIGTKSSEINLYPIDCASILHLIGGIFCFILSYPFYMMFFPLLASLLLSSITAFVVSIIWEILENTILLEIKANKRMDTMINSQCDTIFVFLGNLCGWQLYNKPSTLIITVIGGLFIIYAITVVLTYKKFWKKKSS